MSRQSSLLSALRPLASRPKQKTRQVPQLQPTNLPMLDIHYESSPSLIPSTLLWSVTAAIISVFLLPAIPSHEGCLLRRKLPNVNNISCTSPNDRDGVARDHRIACNNGHGMRNGLRYYYSVKWIRMNSRQNNKAIKRSRVY